MTLFLDRDGVINHRLINDYVKSVNEFVFEEGALEAIAKLSKCFERIVVVTNQQGVGKKMMSEKTLHDIHEHMKNEVEKAGGRIDAVYFCPDVSGTKSICRKPNIGMGLLAKKQFSEIRFKQSVMVGDTISDMKFGKKLGMKTVLISTDKPLVSNHSKLIDQNFNSLYEYAKTCC
ncbi:MAG: HAD family hydrolase [Bacteroidales bacterium]|jgi:histidinol-phosphate phosphatase family protein|nr:HAD family hydrolase [Bacteroidales bacterium]